MADPEPAAPPAGWWPKMVALGLVAVLVGAILIAVSAKESRPEVVGGNRPVNAGAGDPLDIRAHNSPTVVRSPLDPAVVVAVNRIDTPRFSCAFHRSQDGGTSWTDLELPFPAGEEAPPRCFAPDAAFDPAGDLFVSFVTLKGLGNEPNAAWVVASSDGGRSFSAPRRALGPMAFQVRLVADPAQPGRVYLSWLQAEVLTTLGFAKPGNPIRVARSDDGGLTWGEAVTASGPGRQRVLAPTPATGGRGEVYLAYLDLREDVLDYHGAHEGRGGEAYPGSWELVLARSTDAGATWSETVVEPRLVPTQRFVALIPPAPSLAVDAARGRVYVAFHDGRLGDPDAWVWASPDRGGRFATPVRVNDTGPRDGTAQYLPKLGVAPDGRLDVAYYDRRADPDDHLNDVSLQSSSDGGRTFGKRVRVSDRAFDSRIGFGSERGMPDLGSRLAITSDDRQALVAWTDTRAGTEVSNKQDLAAATVRFPRDGLLQSLFR